MASRRILSELLTRWQRGDGKRNLTLQTRRRRLLVEQLEDRKLLAAVHPLPLSSLNGTYGFRIDGVDAGDNSGWSVSNAGDVNGDGFDDLILGARLGDAGAYNSGESYVVFGKSGGFTSALALSSLDGTNGFRLDGISSNEQSGNSVSSAGDVNGDGFDDLIVGTRYGGPGWPGESHVIFGKSTGFGPAMSLFGLDGTTGGFRIQGATSGDRTGYSVSGAGDVNGDGFDDLIVGGLYASPSGRISAGSSYVIFGKSGQFGTPDIRGSTVFLNALSGNNGFRLDGVDQLDRSGRKVSSAGDVNGDGLDDLLVAAREGDTGGYNSGESYVVFGKTGGFPATIALSSLDGTNGFRLDGIDTYDGAGVSLSSAGDVNGDGFDDLIVGASGADHLNTNSSGESYVVFGKSGGFASNIALSGLNGTNGFRIDGTATNDASGYSVSGAGDVNGDGFDDLIIGAFGVGANPFRAGAGYLLFGKSGGFASAIALASLNGNNGFRMDGVNPNDGAGRSLSGAGDVNGDGFDDLIVGTPTADPNGNDSGSSYVIFGGNFTGGVETQVGGSANETLTANQGPAAVDILIGGLGNDTLVSDGGSDVLIGGPGEDILAITDTNFTGTRRLVGGNGFDTLRLDGSNLTLDLTTIADNRIIDIEQIDLGTTGTHELVITGQEVRGLSSHSNTLTVLGRFAVVRLMEGGWSTPTTVTLGGIEFLQYTNGAATLNVESTLVIRLVVMDLSSLNGANGFRLDGAAADDFSGRSVSSAGDVNGDGFDDLIVGAEGADPNGDAHAGSSYVVFGKSGGFDATINLSTLNGTNGFRLDGVAANDISGRRVSSAGDVNGDGFDDLIVGAPNTNHNVSFSGSIYVVFGKSGGFNSTINLSTLNGANGFRLDGNNRQQVGQVMKGAGDVNGDGFGDLIVGLADLNGDFSGSSYVVFGKSGGFASSINLSTLNGTNGFRLDGVAEVGLPNGVGSAGDVNGDGFDDLIVGDGEADPNGSNSGSSYVLFGKSVFAATINLTTLNGTNGFRLDGVVAEYGLNEVGVNEVGSAGDVNGDGFDDLFVGTAYADPNGDLSGSSYVVFGKSGGFDATINLSTLIGTNGFRLDGVAESDRFGIDVSSAGDVNGDGFDDLIVGAIGVGNNGVSPNENFPGASYVVYGKSGGFAATINVSTLDGTNGFRLDGVDDERSGWSVSSAEDVNGDGFDDLIVGGPFASPNGNLNAGSSYVVFGGNFTGLVETQVGGDGSETLTAFQGASAIDILIGGRGNDTLISDGGSDVLIGGQGDDRLVFPDLNFASRRRASGGNGFDTLVLQGSGHLLDLTSIRDNRIEDIEQIDITGSGNNTLTLSHREVLNLSTHSNTLIVRRNSGDTVNISSGWTQGANETIGPDVFLAFSQGQALLKIQAVASIAGRHAFYNNSAFDFDSDALTAPFGTGSDLADANDDFAMATDKLPLLPGGTATFANYTSFSKGINGLMIDMAGLQGTPTASDFVFRIGNDNTPGTWAAAPLPTSITRRTGAGVGGSDRVTLVWANNAIQKTWLQITVLATLTTGLASPDVFYFGNAIGETGDAPTTNAFVDAIDRTRMLNNPRNFLNRAPATNLHDVNRDSLVDAVDRTIALNNSTNFLTDLNLITVPGPGGGGGGFASFRGESGSKSGNELGGGVPWSSVGSDSTWPLPSPLALRNGSTTRNDFAFTQQSSLPRDRLLNTSPDPRATSLTSATTRNVSSGNQKTLVKPTTTKWIARSLAMSDDQLSSRSVDEVFASDRSGVLWD